MTLRRWLFDVSPDATTLSTSNVVSAPAGAVAATVSIGSGGEIQSSSAISHLGGFSARFKGGGTVSQTMRLPFVASSSQVAVEFYHRAAALPGTSQAIVNVRHSSGQLARVAVLTTGAVAVQTAAGVNIVSTGSGAWVAGRWNRIAILFDNTGGTTAGVVSVAVYNNDSTTADDTASSSTADLGTALATTVDIGSPALSSSTWEHWFDSFQMNDGATAFIGPYVASNAAPTVTLTGNQNVAVSASVTATATASDTDGSIASYAWTYDYPASGGPTLSGASTATVGFAAGAEGSLYILRCTVTDDDGATAFATTEVRVPKAGDFGVLPMDGVAVGAWTRTGGTTDGGALNDASDATYTESPDYSGTAATEEYRIEPLAARSALQFVVRTQVTSLGGTTLVQLMEGATQRQQWTLSQSTAAADQTLTVTSPGAISDFGNLRLRFSAAT